MQHRTVFEVMTHDVITAAPTTPFKEIARLFADHDVSAVPVVDADPIRVSVDDRVVRLVGRIDERADIPVIVRLCRSVDGVIALHESIAFAYDNLALDVEPPR
ncbi:CBS domain-containing protein [Streptomyces narbonensis]|uniref:CBS domain-containing protein n=1 Tax=Streptomyces narbonensis TaxID=67333 RepID=A0ABV3C569_9ACTN